eukprot:TRINITY_DN1917_c0_g1_i1.p1 TRINITY_DN1917_c0_g1~~TRINITY_DN1917_c0_g1_i1.p1  ORF type:complete len:100 (-),score=37.00 TRINITY_DN1917_c0_g1_i1:179-478(-)
MRVRMLVSLAVFMMVLQGGRSWEEEEDSDEVEIDGKDQEDDELHVPHKYRSKEDKQEETEFTEEEDNGNKGWQQQGTSKHSNNKIMKKLAMTNPNLRLS